MFEAKISSLGLINEAICNAEASKRSLSLHTFLFHFDIEKSHHKIPYQYHFDCPGEIDGRGALI